MLNSIQFEFEIELPYKYLDRFSKMLYGDSDKKVLKFAIMVCNDSFYTYTNIVH